MSKSSGVCRLEFRVAAPWELRGGHFHFTGPIPDLRGLRPGTTFTNMDQGIHITVLENKVEKSSCLVRFSVHEDKVCGLGLGTVTCALLVKPKKGTMSTEGKKGAAMILTTFLERMLEEARTRDTPCREDVDIRSGPSQIINGLDELEKSLKEKLFHLKSDNLKTEQKLKDDNQRKEKELKKDNKRKEHKLKMENGNKVHAMKNENKAKLNEMKGKLEEHEASRKRKRAGPECPVCLEELGTARIFQCSSGHLLCSSCYSRVKECPSR